MEHVWRDLLLGALLFSLFPLGLVLLAWRDWKTSPEGGKRPITTCVLAVESIAALALPAMLMRLRTGYLPNPTEAQRILVCGFLTWSIALLITAVAGGRGRRFTIPAGLISLMLYSLGAAGA